MATLHLAENECALIVSPDGTMRWLIARGQEGEPCHDTVLALMELTINFSADDVPRLAQQFIARAAQGEQLQ